MDRHIVAGILTLIAPVFFVYMVVENDAQVNLRYSVAKRHKLVKLQRSDGNRVCNPGPK